MDVKKTLSMTFGCLIVFTFSHTIQNQTVMGKYEKALQLMGKGEFDRAVSRLTEIVENHPDFHRAYKKLTDAYQATERLDKAINYFNQLIHQSPKNGCAYYGLGVALEKKEAYTEAANALKKAIELDSRIPHAYECFVEASLNQKGGRKKWGRKLEDDLEAWVKKDVTNAFRYYGLGYFYQTLYENDKGLAMIDKAIALEPGMVQAHYQKMNIYYVSTHYHEALKILNVLLESADPMKDQEFKADLLCQSGKVHAVMGNYEKALNCHEESLAMSRMIGELRIAGKNLECIGLIYWRHSDFEKALNYYKQALVIQREIGDKRDQGSLYSSMGIAYRALSDYEKALEYFGMALWMDQEVGNKLDEAVTYNCMGNVYRNTADYGRALEYYEKALAIHEEIGNRRSEGIVISNMGIVYDDLGDFQRASECYQTALKIHRKIGNQFSEGITLNNLGSTSLRQGDYAKALTYFNNSLKIHREISNKQSEGIALKAIGECHENLKRYDEALDFYRKALVIHHEIGDLKEEGYTGLSIGHLNLTLKKTNEAMEYYNKALEIGKRIKQPDIIWEAYHGLGSALEEQARYAKALQYCKLSIEEIERVRGLLPMNKFKAGFLENKIRVYERAVRLLYELHERYPKRNYEKESFHCVEKAKARALYDIICGEKAFHDMTEIPPDFRQILKTHRNQMESGHAKLSDELSKPDSEKNNERVVSLEGELESLERKEAKLLEKLRKTNPRLYGLTHPVFLTAEDLRRNVIQENQMLIEYFVGDEKTFVWIIAKDSFEFKTIALSRKALEIKLSRVSPIFTKAKNGIDVQIDHRWSNLKRDLLHELYEILLEGPAGKFLQGSTELIIVPDDLLCYFPFEILVTEAKGDAIHYLVEKHPISYVSSANLLNPDLRKERKAQKDLLAFGGPDFKGGQRKGILDWIRSTGQKKSVLGNDRFGPLPNAKAEVLEIAKEFNNPAIYIGREATEDRFKRMAKEFRFIHLATHYVNDDKRPLYSKIVLSQTGRGTEDGILQTYEVYNLELNADLVVLSGCSTGLGRLSRGEGLIGLSRAFLYAGAPSLVVSMWPVEDESTARFMKAFYAYLKGGLNKAQALQRTKVDMIRSNGIKGDPFYWGPFILIGDRKEIENQ